MTPKSQIEVLYYLDTSHYVLEGFLYSFSGGWTYFNPSPAGVPPAATGSALVGVVNPYAGTPYR